MKRGQPTGHAAGAHRSELRATIIRDLINVTWRMLLPTMVGLFGGMYLDTLLGSSPAGFLIGSALGFVFGVWLALKVLKQAREMSSS